MGNKIVDNRDGISLTKFKDPIIKNNNIYNNKGYAIKWDTLGTGLKTGIMKAEDNYFGGIVPNQTSTANKLEEDLVNLTSVLEKEYCSVDHCEKCDPLTNVCFKC